ncbi:MAG: hypothetical protein QOF89_3176 [Acidobacteriota bacterium]|jgi:hypothetical protein|nr:hypothetical protein [Acidobacteriota bacterium]
MKLNQKEAKRRILGRNLLKEISIEDLEAVGGGISSGTSTCTSTACGNDSDSDCDQAAEF